MKPAINFFLPVRIRMKKIIPLCLAAAFALGTGEAAAQDAPVVVSPCVRQILQELDESIYCRYGRIDRNNRQLLIHNPRIVVNDEIVSAIESWREGNIEGQNQRSVNLDISVFAVEWPAREGIPVTARHPDPLDTREGIYTYGNPEDYLTGVENHGIFGRHTGEGRLGIDVRNVSIRTTGDSAFGIYGQQEGSYVFRDGGTSTRAKGLVLVNLMETDRDREQRVRPLVGTRGDNADAVRAMYSGRQAHGHVAVTVEGYTIATGGIVPLEAVAPPQQPSHYVFDPSRLHTRNRNYDPDDPSSPEFINILLRYKKNVDGTPMLDDDGNPIIDVGNPVEIIDLRPYTVAYLPVRNPDYKPEYIVNPDYDSSDPDSERRIRNPNYDPDSDVPEFIAGSWNPGTFIWNGRYFLSLPGISDDDVAACRSQSGVARRICYEDRLAAKIMDLRDGLPTGYGARGIYAGHQGRGDIRVRVTDTRIWTGGAEAYGIYASHAEVIVERLLQAADFELIMKNWGEVDIDVTGGSITTLGQGSHGIWGRHRGIGGVDIDVTDATIATEGRLAHGVFGLIQQTCIDNLNKTCQGDNLLEGTGVGNINIDVTGGSITTKGMEMVWDRNTEEFNVVRGPAYAVHARHENEGDIAIRMMGVTVATESDEAHGVFAEHRGARTTVAVTDSEGTSHSSVVDEVGVGQTRGDITIDVTGGSVSTMGERAYGVYGEHRGAEGAVSIATAAAVSTAGEQAHGVFGWHIGKGGVTLNVTDGSVTTAGADAYGVRGLHTGTEGGLTFRMTGGSIETTGERAYGAGVQRQGDKGDVTIGMTGGSVTTAGADAHGLYAGHEAARVVTGEGTEVVTEFRPGSGNVGIDVGGSVTTAGSGASGVYGVHTGSGNVGIDVGGSVTTAGADAHGIYVLHQGTGDVTIDVDGSVTARGDGSDGIRVVNRDEDGDVTVTVGQGASVMGGRYGVLVSSGVTASAPSTAGTGVRSDGLGLVGTGIAVPLAHGENHFQFTNQGTITGGQTGVMLGDNGQLTNRGAITGAQTGVEIGASGQVENRGGITGGQTGVMLGDNGQLTNRGAITGAQTGVQIGANGRVENPGMIEGQVGIRAGADGMVVISGTVRSTEGPEGTAIHFTEEAEEENTVTLRRGTDIVGGIRVYDQDDLVDASDVPLHELGSLRIVDAQDEPLRNVRLPSQGGGRLIRVGGTVLGLDTTAFALTDEVLSDLTGNIHAAVIGNGLSADAGEGDPARGRIWAAPFGGAREQNGVGVLADGTHYFGGGMLGAGWGTVMRVGVFVGGSAGQLDVDNVQTIDMQTVFGGAYAQRAWGDLLLDARFLMGSMDHDSTRRMGPNSAGVKYTSIFLSPEIGIATNMQLMSRLWATPRLRVRYAGLFTEGFRERGRDMLGRYTGWDLRYAKRDVQIVEARGQVGIPIALENGGRIEPRVGLEGRYLVAGDTVDAAVPTDGNFTTDAGGDKGVATGSLGLGMSVPVADGTSLVGNFDGAFTTDHAWRATGYLGLVYSF